MSATDIAAWIGAVTGTLVLIWDVYKWMQTGPKVKVSVDTQYGRLWVGRGDPW